MYEQKLQLFTHLTTYLRQVGAAQLEGWYLKHDGWEWHDGELGLEWELHGGRTWMPYV